MSEQGHEVGDTESMLEWITGNGQEHRAYRAIEQGDYEKARRLLEPVAARDSVYSLLTLGGFYEAGNLGPPDLKIALSYYERAASRGSAEAQRRLGRLLLDQGEEAKARTAFEHGADAGNISCMFWLGKMMVEGRGGLKEVRRGVEWLEAAAAQGHFYAMRKLLAIEAQACGSIVRRAAIGLQILLLGLRAGREMWKDSGSDRLR